MSDHPAVVEAYTDLLSYEPGDIARLHAGATVPRPSGRVVPAPSALPFDVEVARLGATREIVVTLDGLMAEPQPIPDDASAQGARWPVTTTFTIGDWRSGFYEALVRAVGEDGVAQETRWGFVVRKAPSAPTAPILFELSTNTWNAYNDWGRSNLYLGGTHVSFRRPWAKGFLDRPEATLHRNTVITKEPDPGGDAWLAYARANQISGWSACAGWATFEGPFVQWAEAHGHVFDYCTNADLEERPSVLDGHPMLLSVGHDEYWSSPMRDTVEGYIAGGGNVAFFSGNTSFWQVRLEDGGDTMVSYKDRARREDPVRDTDPSLLTSIWSDPIIGRPESHMTGVTFTRGGYARQGGCTPRGQRGYTIWRPEHWIFEGTGLCYGDLFGDDHCIVGYECDGVAMQLENGLPVPTHEDGSPETFQILGSAPARVYSVDPARGINEYPTGLAAMRTIGELQGLAHNLFGDMSDESVEKVAHGNAVLGSYTSPGGGTVVTSGCTDWIYGVAGGDPLVQQVTDNVLRRLSAPTSG